MKKATLLLAVVAVLAMALPAYGTLWEGWWKADAASNDFHDSSNWTWAANPGSPPAGLQVGDTTGGDAWYLHVGPSTNSPEITATTFTTDLTYLSIAPGAEVIMNADYGTGGGGQLYINGTFRQVSGTYSYNNYPRIGSGAGNSGVWEISGGSIDGWSGLSLGVDGAVGTFVINNSQGGPTKILLYTFSMSEGSTLKVMTDSNGYVTPITTHGHAITVDGTLIVDHTTGGFSPSPGDRIAITQGGDYTDKGIELDPASYAAGWRIDHTVTDHLEVVFVPEPATLVLLGLGGCLALLRRKK